MIEYLTVMAAVAQWQSTALWMQMLRVRPPSAAPQNDQR